ncbi:alpha/beta fold hydrolase [Dyadobacter pollutisoli]|jgi:proline iminopeptidase|uniref:Alpha/beta hydrolase n=1 Tax=Dyadobacter pollutisoli TaxID=2910158 RepID=A0A9E8N9H5_9BACT|nr:alpha/beta hydrolase [Dyadobacter pollutisoli]WAC10941.1 alpha/beta hydrolase [Dyadobacter pollutisoli]
MRVILIALMFLGFIPQVRCQDGFVKGFPRLAYWKLGDKPQVIIVLHGGPAVQHEYLRPEFDLLNKHCSVIYYDQRGCGRSQQDTTYIWEEHVKDLKRVIKTLSAKNKVFLAGSSWGSTLAMIYAYKHPEDVKGIILSGTYHWEGMNQVYHKKTYRQPVRSHKQIVRESGILLRQNVDQSISEEPLSIFKEIEMYTDAPAFETRDSFVSAPTIDSLRRVNLPILLFNGSRTCQIDCADEYMNVFSKAELYTIKGACHDPWMSDPELFAATCNRFILKHK